MLTVRESIVSNVVSRMETILTDNDYETNAGSKVFVWREYPSSSFNFPCLIIRDSDESIENVNDIEHLHRLFVEIGIISTSHDEARQILGDVYKACGVDFSWGGYAFMTEPVAADLQVEHQNTIIADISFRIIINYMTIQWDAYNILT